MLWRYKCGCPDEIEDASFYKAKDNLKKILKIKDSKNFTNRFLQIEDKNYIYTIAKVTNTSREKEFNGFIIMGIELDNTLIKNMGKAIGKDVSYYSDIKDMPIYFSNYKNGDEVDYKKINLKEKRVDVVFTYPNKKDISPIYLYLKEPIDILSKGYELAFYISITMFVLIALFILFLGYVIEKTYILPLEHIKSDIQEIIKRRGLQGQEKNYSEKQVKNLKTVVYKMVKFLQEDSRTIDAKALYAQGQEDIKAGILHNTKNSLTPIALSLEDLLYAIKKHGAVVDNAKEAIKKLNEIDDDKELEKDIKEYLEIVSDKFVKFRNLVASKIETALDMLEITESMLSSKNFNKNSDIYIKKIILKDIVSRVIDEQKRISKGIDIKYEINIDENLSIETSPVYIENIIINIMSNSVYAIKNSKNKSKGIIVIKALKFGQNELQFSISDNGVGISEKNLTKVFQRGFSTKRGFRKSGEGLHWTASVVQKIGGNIKVDSEGVNRGTIVSITLPIKIQI